MSTYNGWDHWDSCGLFNLVDYTSVEPRWAVIRVKPKILSICKMCLLIQPDTKLKHNENYLFFGNAMLRNVPGHIWAELVSPELMAEQVFNINYNFGGKLEGPYLVTARVNTLCCCIHESQSSRSIVVQIKYQHQRNPRGKKPRKTLPPTLYIPLALHPSDQLHPADPFYFANCHHLQ